MFDPAPQTITTPTKPDSEVVKALIRAKAIIINPDHWIKGVIYDGNQRRCAIGAVRAVMFGVYDPHYNAVVRALHPDKGEDGVYDFNDDNSTTHADVIAMFDAAIERERAK